LQRSTDRQDKSLSDQRREIERFAREQGFSLVDFYEDDAISGIMAGDRLEFPKLLGDAESKGRRWDFVLTYSISRFGRLDNDEASHYRFRLRRVGVEVLYSTSPTASAAIRPTT